MTDKMIKEIEDFFKKQNSGSFRITLKGYYNPPCWEIYLYTEKREITVGEITDFESAVKIAWQELNFFKKKGCEK